MSTHFTKMVIFKTQNDLIENNPYAFHRESLAISARCAALAASAAAADCITNFIWKIVTGLVKID